MVDLSKIINDLSSLTVVEAAEEIKKKLEAAGAKVELK
jgi:ribosomal protein L7/L12